jgi:radical SAM superfamily enzyme YgiQ (UPF0313 family)
MKILLTTLNAKYVHTSLALWYLYQFCHEDYPDLTFKEFNINQELAWINGEIYLEYPDVVGFSCNIWNIKQTLVLCKWLKALSPKLIVVLGGSEVSANPSLIMATNPAVDFIIAGEGELTFKEWLAELTGSRRNWAGILGLVYREGEQVIQNSARPDISDLSIVPFPYPEDLSSFRQKLVYYETSRGCPYSCQYCLSANERGVRFFPRERVKADLLKFIESGIAQVKFVDRSFNCNPAWAKEIWRFLLAHPGQTNFHFEIVGDLLDEESLEILAGAPLGLFQFEIGVQSTHPETLALIERRMDFNRLGEKVVRLVQTSKVFVHLDLIAGLPGEDYRTFAKSFNDNLRLKPDRLQLGFLKLLHGSGLRNKAAEYGYIFSEEPPYEVMTNRWISFEELLKLKVIEDLLERYYNSGHFKTTFAYLLAQYPSSFEFFEQFAAWWKKQGYDQVSHKVKDLYGYLLYFYQSQGHDGLILRNLLKYDLLSCERMVELPEWAGKADPELHREGYKFWQDAGRRAQYIPDMSEWVIRDIQRRVLFEEFDFNPQTVEKKPWTKPLLQPQIILFVYGGPTVMIHRIDREEFTI